MGCIVCQIFFQTNIVWNVIFILVFHCNMYLCFINALLTRISILVLDRVEWSSNQNRTVFLKFSQKVNFFQTRMPDPTNKIRPMNSEIQNFS